MFSGSSFQIGTRVYCDFTTSSTIISMSSSAFDRLHLRAMDHDVGNLQIAQVEHATEHVRIVARNRTFLGLQLDRATDLLVRRQDVRLVVLRSRRELEDRVDDHTRPRPSTAATPR